MKRWAIALLVIPASIGLESLSVGRSAAGWMPDVSPARGLSRRPQGRPPLTGPYLGQKPPGTTPEVFAPGTVSTDAHEFSCCFSPDGREFYFARRHPQLGRNVIMGCRSIDGTWTEPEVTPFSKDEFAFEPFVTPDNRRLYFQAGRAGDKTLHMYTLYVERADTDGWGEVQDPGDAFNPDKTMHISSSADGTLYTTDISGGMGNEALGIIRRIDGAYGRLERLGPPFDKDARSQHPWIAPDGNTIIYSAGRAAESVLRLSRRTSGGIWSEPTTLPLGRRAGQPFATSDGRFLFFTSQEHGAGDIYWVSAEVLEDKRGSGR